MPGSETQRLRLTLDEHRVGEAQGQLAAVLVEPDLHGSVPEAVGDHLEARSRSEVGAAALLVARGVPPSLALVAPVVSLFGGLTIVGLLIGALLAWMRTR